MRAKAGRSSVIQELVLRTFYDTSKLFLETLVCRVWKCKIFQIPPSFVHFRYIVQTIANESKVTRIDSLQYIIPARRYNWFSYGTAIWRKKFIIFFQISKRAILAYKKINSIRILTTTNATFFPKDIPTAPKLTKSSSSNKNHKNHLRTLAVCNPSPAVRRWAPRPIEGFAGKKAAQSSVQERTTRGIQTKPTKPP